MATSIKLPFLVCMVGATLLGLLHTVRCAFDAPTFDDWMIVAFSALATVFGAATTYAMWTLT